MVFNRYGAVFRALVCAAVLALGFGLDVQAQTAVAAKPQASVASGAAASVASLKAAVLSGPTLDGQAFNLEAMRGKVVLLMLWSTDCAACRDRMPELRDNYLGWKGKPFEIVAVSMDNKRDDLLMYRQVISSAVKPSQRFPWLWAGEPSYKDNFGKPAMLPMSYLIDKNGMVVKSFVGRIPAEVWDQIAEMVY